MILSHPAESFAAVARRLNVVPRVIVAQEWVRDGDRDELLGLLHDLERELLRAIRENEADLEEAA